ncbi:MAG: AAA family ATPase, partial [Candidatus Korarchaeota archaeon]|nr:AAA family ATPase [Candidatus Korarchaeota archaeon]
MSRINGGSTVRFKAIEVRNIRSYKKERVEVPEGSVVLAGNVGAGKSSLLLAMEFALFG